MGGGFMADNKDKTMQQHTPLNTTAKQRKPHQQQQQDLAFRHSHQALCAQNAKPKLPSLLPSPAAAPLERKTPDPPTSTTPTTTITTTTTTSNPPPTSLLLSKQHKKKLLKVILKVPHSSPTPSSPLSRPSPRSPSYPPAHHRHHPHLHLSPSPPPSTSPSPLPSPSAQPPPSQPHLLHRQKLPSELQPRPSKPPPQQVKHPPLDPQHHVQKKSHQSSSQLPYKGHHETSNFRLQCVAPNGEPVPPDLKTQQKESIESQSKSGQTGILSNSSHRKCAEQLDLANSRRYERADQVEVASPRHTRRAEHVRHVEQVDPVNPSLARQTEQADIANPSSSKQTEQGQYSNSSRFRRGNAANEALTDPSGQTGEPDLSDSHTEHAEEVNLHRSCPWRLGGQQLDEKADLKRPQRNHQQQEENHTTPYPKRLRSSYQGLQEQGRSELGTPKVQPHNKLPQNSCQQHSSKKLTQGSVQGPHGSHQNSKISSHTSSPHPFPPSTPASMQSSAPSLSTSAASDEAQKPSKKRNLRSLLEPESTEGQSLAADFFEGQLQVNHSMPPSTSAVNLSVATSSPVEILDSKECTAAISSPKNIHQGSQLIPAKGLLNSILDRLQKKDKFGVFAEPVDPKEVPNYHDIIKDPMDFGTMRNRISSGHYMTIELFQRDIFLICDNAMQYNGKGTVYFRHARAIKDVAERILEDLRISGISFEVDETTTKLKNGGTNRYTEKHDSCMNAGSPSEARIDNLDDVSGYLFRTNGLIDGRRSQAIDENRRNTYAPLTTPLQGNDSLSTTISGDSLHLVPTGYQMDYSYSKSLARFAADLGPLVWKLAAEKIKKALPPGCPFGPGWVGERESGGVVLAQSTKQPLVGQSTTQLTAKLPSANEAVAASESRVSTAIQAKLDTQSYSEGRNTQPNHEIVMKAECQPGLQASSLLPKEIKSPMVFGNSLVQIGRSEGLDQRVLGQSATQALGDNGRSLAQAHSQVGQEGGGKVEQLSSTAGNKQKFAAQVNLNHPVSLQADEGGSIDDRFSNRDFVLSGRDAQEANISGTNVADLPVGNVGGFPFEGTFNLGGPFNSRPPKTDRINQMSMNTNLGGAFNSRPLQTDRVSLMSTNTAVTNQYDGRGATQMNRLNDNASTKAGPIVTSLAKNDVHYQPNNCHMSRGPLMPHNLNMSLQQPSSVGISGSRDGNSFNLASSSSSLPQAAQRLTFQSNLNTGVRQTDGGNQHSNSRNHAGSCDVSPQEPGLSAPPCLERTVGERFKEGRDLREQEMLSLASRVTPGTAVAVPGKGFMPDRSFAIQRLEGRNGQISRPDLTSSIVHSLDHPNRKQSTSGGPAAASSSSGLPTSNGVSMVREVPGRVPSQQPDSIPVTGKGGTKLHNQVLKSPLEQLEGPSGGAPFMRLQTSGIQDPQVPTFGSKKYMPSVPHFLQQQLGIDNNHCLPNQPHQMPLHLQSNSLLLSSQNQSPLDSREANFVRQFQPPSHLGFTQTGNPPWAYMSPQMVAQVSHQPFAAAPDLNVSLPLTKSSFDQANANDIQQPDLALQL
ncbi:hypothetical protein L7F22_062854 [Adiantum nelumboides]|nr:hypothetical protein [Adiantum nelumboides]